MDRRRLTPREELRKDKNLTILAGFQYQNSFSVSEMNDEFEKQKLKNTDRTSPIITAETDQTQTAESIIYSSADYVLSYLTPSNKKSKKTVHLLA